MRGITDEKAHRTEGVSLVILCVEDVGLPDIVKTDSKRENENWRMRNHSMSKDPFNDFCDDSNLAPRN